MFFFFFKSGSVKYYKGSIFITKGQFLNKTIGLVVIFFVKFTLIRANLTWVMHKTSLPFILQNGVKSALKNVDLTNFLLN